MDLSSPVTVIPGVGESTAQKLSRLQISSVFDLLYHLPFRYEDRSEVTPVSRIKVGSSATVIGTLDFLKNQYSKSGKIIQVGQLTDSTGSVPVLWFNQPFLPRTLKKGLKVAVYGHGDFYRSAVALVSPEYERVEGELLHMSRIVPVYPETAGISSKWLRHKIRFLLSSLPVAEILPHPGNLLPWKQAVNSIHFPSDMAEIYPAKNRLAFDEIFLLQLTSIMRKAAWTATRLSHPFTVDQESVLRFIHSLPFSLTVSQNQAIKDILSDLKNSRPMNRLLEGDVGSGKTVVAAVASYVTHLNGFQTLIMAPTQILAAQHFQTLSALFDRLGIKISLVTGSRKISSKLLAESSIVVGTHALISNTRTFDRSGLVIIDEQHRFGVSQRALAGSLGKSPHILTMTATPIPRTVALTMYGDLDISILSEKPVGRLPVKTWVVPESKRQSAYQWITEQISQNQGQVFIVCPFINDSETLTSVKAAAAEFDRLKSVFPSLQLGLIHGRLKSKEKDVVINQFRQGQISVLVATPVVEVGLDIPNAAVMVVEGAERFGLAQLHQLRGRVGRSFTQSYCLLFTSDGTISPRLKAMEKFNSGLELAETDLKLRGPGQIYGTAQHGFPEFKVASYTDLPLIEAARAEAEKVFPRLKTYPVLRALVKEDKIQLVQPN